MTAVALRHSIAAVIGATVLVVLSACAAGISVGLGWYVNTSGDPYAATIGSLVFVTIAGGGLREVFRWAEEVRP